MPAAPQPAADGDAHRQALLAAFSVLLLGNDTPAGQIRQLLEG
jgi:hypothetical protein